MSDELISLPVGHSSQALPRQVLVGDERFELPTSCSQSKRTTRLC